MILDLGVAWPGCVRRLLVVVVWIVCFKLGERLRMMVRDRNERLLGYAGETDHEKSGYGCEERKCLRDIVLVPRR